MVQLWVYMFDIIDPNNLSSFIKLSGYLGIALIIFTESGLFFGFFLPGDSLLFTAGILAGNGVFNLPVLIVVIVCAAILGDNVGYFFGKYVGNKLLTSKTSFFLRKEHINRAHIFYEKYGSKAIILARFVPVVRTFVPIMAGVAEMNYLKFLKYNIIGGLLWGVGITSLGYILGTRIKNIDTYLLPIILIIIVASCIPVIYEVYRGTKK